MIIRSGVEFEMPEFCDAINEGNSRFANQADVLEMESFQRVKDHLGGDDFHEKVVGGFDLFKRFFVSDSKND